MSERKKVLWLVSWYPNKYDCFDGDFIQRHAKAAALFDDIHVIFIKESVQQTDVEESWDDREGLTEQLIYLPKKSGLRRKAINFLQWQRIFKSAAAAWIEKHKPDIVHVHIPWKAGLIALWIKRKYGIPYLVTEHWGIYNDVVDDNIHNRSFIVRNFLRRLYKRARSFITVSRFLGEGVRKTLVERDYTVVPNVTDTSLFYPSSDKMATFTFLHVSNMVPLKNVGGILYAFEKFLETSKATAQLILVGNKDNTYPKMAEELGLLNQSVFFKNEIPYREVAAIMRSAHVFILNSHIENSPCVIGEALCCGLPVIATNVGGIPELINDQNGVLIAPQNNEELCNAMHELYRNYQKFNQAQIASAAKQKFSFETIGRQLHELYLESK